MGRIGVGEMILVVLVVVALFGVKKLPEIGAALGKALREFKKAGKEVTDVVKDKSDEKKNS